MFQRLKHKFSRAAQIHRNFGATATLQHAVNIMAGPVCDFEALEVLWLDADDIVLPQVLSEEMEARFLTPEEVAAFAVHPENELTESLVERARADTDACFGIISNGHLASYTWYSTPEDVPADDFGLRKRVPPGTAYMHNAFTPQAWRGRRLYGIGVALAFRELSRHGITALLTDIDWSNHASRRGCRRAGFQSLGCLYSFGLGNYRFSIRPRRARKRHVTFRRYPVEAAIATRPLSVRSGEIARRTAFT